VCYQCQTAIPAGTDEVAWVCPQCGSGLLLSEEKGTSSLQVHFSSSIPAGATGWPFWVTRGTVTLRQRLIFGGGDQGGQARELWQVPRQFCIPAFTCTLDQMVEQGTRMLLQPPALQSGSPAAFQSVVTHPEDVQVYAEFIVLGIEASRKDKLKNVDFSLSLEPPELWVLP
jgi:hypothetical protein